jgi:SPP1 family predicted phage head-tail adaptor
MEQLMRDSYPYYMDVLLNTPTQDDIGGTVTNWAEVDHWWCAFESITSSEVTEHGARRNENRRTIYIQNEVEVSKLHRLRYRDKVYEVESFDYDDEEGETIVDAIRIEMNDDDFVDEDS